MSTVDIDAVDKALQKYYSQKYHTVEDEFNDGRAAILQLFAAHTTHLKAELLAKIEELTSGPHDHFEMTDKSKPICSYCELASKFKRIVEEL